MTIAYATRRRTPAPSLAQPRNMRAVDIARERGEALVVSFIGDTPYPNPTVYCDSGVRYDWAFAEGLSVLVVARPGINTVDALDALVRYVTHIGGHDYPVLIDLKNEEAANVVDGWPLQLWQVRKGAPTWQQYFKP
jgi:hypothetical protein